jgi:hypothetical protein
MMNWHRRSLIVATKTNIADRVKKGQGASIYYEEEKVLPQEGTQPQTPPGTDKEPDPQLVPSPNPKPEPQPDKELDTGTGTDTDTLLYNMLKPSESYIRKVYYPLERQDNYIKKKAKKHGASESEIVRIMLDFFIKSSMQS